MLSSSSLVPLSGDCSSSSPAAAEKPDALLAPGKNEVAANTKVCLEFYFILFLVPGTGTQDFQFHTLPDRGPLYAYLSFGVHG